MHCSSVSPLCFSSLVLTDGFLFPFFSLNFDCFFSYLGRKLELKDDREKARELYLEVKSEVGRCLAYLKEKRERDPYRSLLSRLLYQSIHGITAEIPTFEL